VSEMCPAHRLVYRPPLCALSAMMEGLEALAVAACVRSCSSLPQQWASVRCAPGGAASPVAADSRSTRARLILDALAVFAEAHAGCREAR